MFIDALTASDRLNKYPRNIRGLESYHQAAIILWFDASDVQRPAWRICHPGFAVVLPDVGNRVSAGLPLLFGGINPYSITLA